MSATAAKPHSQTLDRGLVVLEAVADAGAGLSIEQLSAKVGLHRSITYRIVRTLEDHQLVRRTGEGLLVPGSGLAVLARSVESSLQEVALPELSDLANRLAMTAFLVVREGDEAVTILSVEPRQSVAHVAYRPGVRHDIRLGAPGHALMAGLPPSPDDSPAVVEARRLGWATSQGQVLPGMTAVSAPISTARGVAGACSVVFIHTDEDLAALGAEVAETARLVGRSLS